MANATGKLRAGGLLAKQTNDAIKGLVSTTKSLLGPWGKVDQAAASFAKHVAISAQGMAELRKQTIQLGKDAKLGAFFGVRPEDLIKMQESYVKAVGRNVTQTNESLTNIAAMSSMFGEEFTIKLAERLERFGLNMTEASKYATKMYKDAAEYGVSYETMSNAVADNFHLAEQYTFQRGRDGLADMARKAIELRLNMSQAAAFANKVGDLEGAITTGAQLQVLGGAFAQFANPIQMLGESYNDLEALQDRMVEMFKGLGTFNKQTGQVEINGFNRKRAKAAAEAMGIDYSNIMEVVTRSAVVNEVEKQMQGLNQFNDEKLAEYVKNVATIENGKAGVVIKGEFRRLADITDRDKEDLRIIRNTQGENIQEIAKSVRSLDEIAKGIEDQKDILQSIATEKTIGQFSKNVAQGIGKTNWLLGLAVTTGITGEVMRSLGGFGGIGKGIFNKGGGGSPKPTGSGLSRGGKIALGTGIGLASAGLGVAGLVGFNQNRKARQNGEYERGSEEDRAKAKSNWGLIGGSIGTALGTLIPIPGLGSAIGGALGYGIGYGIGALRNIGAKKALQQKEDLRARGIDLHGDYTNKQMKILSKALEDGVLTNEEYGQFSRNLKKKLKKSGDMDIFPGLRNVNMSSENANLNAQNLYINANGHIDNGTRRAANGGLLNGPSHANGGMRIYGTNIEVEGGEFVVNKQATKNNIALLETINKIGKNTIIKPRKLENGGAIPVIPSVRKVSSVGESRSTEKKETLSVAPITLNVNGTIKLDAGNGNNIDLGELLKNTTFLQKLSRMVEEELNRGLHGGAMVVNRAMSNI